MLLFRITVILIACWIVKCDLLDLYVQHMDETMRTKWYKKHPIDSVPRRIKRSFGHEVPRFRLSETESLKADRLSIERLRHALSQHKLPIDSIEMRQFGWKSWSRQIEEMERRLRAYEHDASNYSDKGQSPDLEEENERPSSIKETAKSVNTNDEMEPKISQLNPDLILNTDKSLEIDESKSIPVENLKNVKEMEKNEIPLFETIKQNRDFPPKFKKYRLLEDLFYKEIKKTSGEGKKQSSGHNSIDRQSFDNSWLKKNEIHKNDIWQYSYAPLKNSDPREEFESSSRVEETETPFIDGEEKAKVSQTPRTERREEDELYMPHYFPESKEEHTDKLLEIEEPKLIIITENSTEDVDEMEDGEDSLFEMIEENRRQFSFDDPSLKKTPKPSETQVPKKYSLMLDKPIKSTENAKNAVAETRNDRPKRDTPNCRFSRYEKLDDDGDIVLEWDPLYDEEVTFRVTGKTTGYIGIGFNDKSNMKNADILLIWVDDHTGVANVVDMHGVKEMNAAPHTDSFQDVRVLGGSQNGTHTTVAFVRKWQTCDPQDYPLSGDTVKVIWAMHHTDPELNTAPWHERKRGGKALRLKTAATYSPPETLNTLHWDVKLNPFNITGDKHTIYWCKIFQFPTAFSNEKLHMIGYKPLVEKANEDLVHHMILYECSIHDEILHRHARLAGVTCYSPIQPKEWNSCMQPVVTWVRGSKGEWLPEHIGLPIGEHKNMSYYMLEVHYNNPSGRKAIDQSGVRLYLSPKLRPNEASILVTGTAVSPLHLVPPQQKEYATAGYCTQHCTNATLPEKGINVVSVVLHSHLAGRRLSLKHIRQGKELPRIVQDNHFDFDYQQSHAIQKEVNVLPGDELVAECVYSTLNRTKPTLGGYAASEEMCLAFIMYYPRTHLTSCFSMTPVEDLFKTLGVISFKGMTMESVKRLFLQDDLISSINQLSANSTSINEKEKTVFRDALTVLEKMRDYKNNDEPNVFTQLIIESPEEFKGRTMADHMINIAWTEELLAKAIEKNLYYGRHMTFCRRKNEELLLSPIVQNLTKYTPLPKTNDTTCSELRITSATSGVPRSLVINLVTIVIVLIVMI